MGKMKRPDGLRGMENAEFNRILSLGEDSRHRFWE